jgi:hypothetical protein
LIDKKFLQPGQMIFIKGLENTARYFGCNSDMNTLIGGYYQIHDITHENGMLIQHHKSGTTYTIHRDDVEEKDCIIEKGPAVIVRPISDLNIKFDTSVNF